MDVRGYSYRPILFLNEIHGIRLSGLWLCDPQNSLRIRKFAIEGILLGEMIVGVVVVHGNIIKRTVTRWKDGSWKCELFTSWQQNSQKVRICWLSGWCVPITVFFLTSGWTTRTVFYLKVGGCLRRAYVSARWWVPSPFCFSLFQPIPNGWPLMLPSYVDGCFDHYLKLKLRVSGEELLPYSDYRLGVRTQKWVCSLQFWPSLIKIMAWSYLRTISGNNHGWNSGKLWCENYRQYIQAA